MRLAVFSSGPDFTFCNGLAVAAVLALVGCSTPPEASGSAAKAGAKAKPKPAKEPSTTPAVEPPKAPVDSPEPAAKPAGAAMTPASIEAEVLATMDTTVSPCDDFYEYACGGWMKANPIPPDRTRYTRSFGVLRERNLVILKDALEGLATANPADVEGVQLGQLYSSCMDEAAIDKAGAEPLVPLLDQVKNLESTAGLMALLGTLHLNGVGAFFGAYVGPDDKDPATNVLQVSQGGLGLPDRSYYTKPDRKEIRDGYLAHLGKNFELLGETPEQAAKTASAVLAFETKLAKLQLTRVERRDPDATYNKRTTAALLKGEGALDWTAYFDALRIAAPSQVIVESPAYLRDSAKLVAATKFDTIKAYLRWSVVRAAAPSLSKSFADANFEFFKQTLRGQKEQEPRWKRCVAQVGRAMPHALGTHYVKAAFAPTSKALAEDLIVRTEAAFEANLPALSWMDDATRGRAVEKMEAVRNKVGYPEKPRSYEGLTIQPGQFVASLAAAGAFNKAYNLAKQGKPVDHTEWGGSPQTVNASYSSTRNQMWFPAGILQAPFFHPEFPMAMNFGGIGMVAGHELTHGFDDKGRKYDGTGMLRQWWDDKAVKSFEERLSCVSEAYSTPEVLPGLHINPDLTMGENIADLGGLAQTFAAYQAWAKENGGDTKPHVKGLTNEQLVFVAFAQVWCTNVTDEALKVRVATDPHSPGRFRVNVPATHTAEFAEVFECTEGQPMAPKTRCEVW